MNYNLLEERWIPVLMRDGKYRRAGAIEALERATEIRCITLASPLDLFSVHRFLLTLLYWKADLAGGVEHLRDSVLGGAIPSEVVNAVGNKAHCFDLFDKQSPFLQDPSARGKNEKKSVGSLFAELASGSNIAHFHHGDDENMRLCLPCATLGMLRVVPWTQAGGAGLTPSVHNAPPIMAFATADTLAMTVGLNLVPLDARAGEAKWFGHFKPTDSTKPIPYLEALTWNPRRILLPPSQRGVCWYCGERNVPTVGEIVYRKNEDTQKRSDSKLFQWEDPAAFYVADFKTIKSTKEEFALTGRDLQYLVDEDPSPKSRVVLKNPAHEGWLLVVPCTNPGNNKTFDHRQLELANVSAQTIRALVPPDRPSSTEGLDGWKEPERVRPPKGVKLFVNAAVSLLTCADWAALSNAAYRQMEESPAAFDVLSGLYWGLRDRKIRGLPSRNSAWLVLKLMAAVPAHLRVLDPDADFCPLRLLPKRQVNEGARTSRYPVSFPRGRRLQAVLRGALDGNTRCRHPQPVDWIGLCQALDQLLD